MGSVLGFVAARSNGVKGVAWGIWLGAAASGGEGTAAERGAGAWAEMRGLGEEAEGRFVGHRLGLVEFYVLEVGCRGWWGMVTGEMSDLCSIF